MPRLSQFIFSVAFAALCASCSGATTGGTAAGTGGASGIEIGDASEGADGPAGQSPSVIDIGNPQGEQPSAPDKIEGNEFGRCPTTALIRMLRYVDEAQHISIAYPSGWTVSEEDDGIHFASERQQVTAIIHVIPEAKRRGFEGYVDSVKERDLSLASITANGFDWALRGVQEDDDGLRYFERYAGNATGHGTLIVELRGLVQPCSPWLVDDMLSVTDEDVISTTDGSDDVPPRTQIDVLSTEPTREKDSNPRTIVIDPLHRTLSDLPKPSRSLKY